MDRDFAQKHQIPLHKLPCPVPVVVIDGRPIVSGKIFEESEPIYILLGDLGCIVSFNIIFSPEHPIVLGLPWFELHNPSIDWRKREIRCPQIENIMAKGRIQGLGLKEDDSTNIPPTKQDVLSHQISTITLQQLCQVSGKEELFLFAVSVVPSSATQGKLEIQIPTKY